MEGQCERDGEFDEVRGGDGVRLEQSFSDLRVFKPPKECYLQSTIEASQE
jgi:hypothetical protein